MRKRRTQRAEQRTTLVAPVVALARSVFSVLFPSDCRLCGLPLVNISRLPVCEECLASLQPIRAPQHAQCGERLMPAQLLVGNRRCHGCHKFQPDFDRAVPYGEYAGSVRGVIHLLRYDSVMPAAPLLGRLPAGGVRHLDFTEDWNALLMAVPLRSSKRRERGFNQSELIASSAAKRLAHRVEIARMLKRQRAAHPQAGLTRDERIGNMGDVFGVTDPARVKGRTVSVVDEVMAAGAAVCECARGLKKAGAEPVFAATGARALKGAQLPETAQSQGEVGETVEAVSV